MLTIKNNEDVYSAPECMVISVKVQGMLCQSGQFSSKGTEFMETEEGEDF